MFYEKGEGVLEENKTTALSYWQRAADQGHAYAAYNIGQAHWTGKDSYEKSLKLAKKYTRISAAQCDAAAIAQLKEMTACAQCGTGSASGVCAGCKQVHYCNKACQLQHWKASSDPHRAHCCAASNSSPAPTKMNSDRLCASCGAHNATKLCSDCRYEGDPRRKVR